MTIFKNYFVTGDYVVAGWQEDSTIPITTINGVPYATGNIIVPDTFQASKGGIAATPIPTGADIVAAFLYSETVEDTSQPPANPGKNGFFNGHAFTAMKLPTKNFSTTSWSPGGCSGNSNGSKIIQGYRADVRPFLPVDANGKIQANASHVVMLADSGSNGNTVPFTTVAALVIIYRVQASPAFPLNSIVIYDGTFAPSNATSMMSEMSQQITGFYQAASSPVAKITHIVSGGVTNKFETVSLINQNGTRVNLPSLYKDVNGNFLPPFPGIYNGSGDVVTWSPNTYGTAVRANDSSETTSVVPTQTGGNCIGWGAIVFNTRVPDPNLDALLPVWKAPASGPPGYTDVISNQFVALPDATATAQHIFVEVDYLTLRDANGNVLHSHLPKQAALDMVGDAFANRNVHVHFDVGPTNYLGNCSTTAPNACPDPYIIQGGTGGNEIPESVTVCNDATSPTPCAFPGTPTVTWKGGFLAIEQDASVPHSTPPIPLGNFQPGRTKSYHYVLFGHAMGAPRSFWTAFGATLTQSNSVTKLISIDNSTTPAKVTIQTPQGLFKPGDCNPANLAPACSDTNGLRVTVGGALGQPALNGTYFFSNLNNSGPDANGVTTTTFNITTAGVANVIYNFPTDFSKEPYLVVSYGGPTSTSGHSDLGGGDSAVTLGLWAADDALGCQPDPSVTLAPGQTYCVNQVGTVTAQAGTLLHEMGHTLFLTHGGTFFRNGTVVAGQQLNSSPVDGSPGLPSYGLNCNPANLTSMSYLFQIRGFPDGGIDYSGQTLPSLSELALNESTGIGSDLFTGVQAPHFTRWYAPRNALDTQVGRLATRHCDGTPLKRDAFGNLIELQLVLVDGSTFSFPIDWNNDLDPVPDPNPENPVSWQDVNFNGSTSNSPDPPPLPAFNNMQGFNDWVNLDLRQVGSRANADEFSGIGGGFIDPNGGGFIDPNGGGFIDPNGGGFIDPNGGGFIDPNGGGFIDPNGGGFIDPTGGGFIDPNGGTEQDQETACSTADPLPKNSLSAVMIGKGVLLNWSPPVSPCQVRRYDIWRAQGSFPTLKSVLANINLFTDIGHNVPPPTPPSTTFTDSSKLFNNTTYTYFVTETNAQGATSRASDPVTIMVSFSTH